MSEKCICGGCFISYPQKCILFLMAKLVASVPCVTDTLRGCVWLKLFKDCLKITRVFSWRQRGRRRANGWRNIPAPVCQSAWTEKRSRPVMQQLFKCNSVRHAMSFPQTLAWCSHKNVISGKHWCHNALLFSPRSCMLQLRLSNIFKNELRFNREQKIQEKKEQE